MKTFKQALQDLDPQIGLIIIELNDEKDNGVFEGRIWELNNSYRNDQEADALEFFATASDAPQEEVMRELTCTGWINDGDWKYFDLGGNPGFTLRAENWG